MIWLLFGFGVYYQLSYGGEWREEGGSYEGGM